MALVVFDFDNSLLEVDSDRLILNLRPELELMEFARTSDLQWTHLMHEAMRRQHVHGLRQADFAQALQQAPLHPAMPSCLRHLKRELGCDLKIVSDANQFFIDTILGHHGLGPLFSQIFTNPAAFNLQGQLEIHWFCESPHGCERCARTPNMWWEVEFALFLPPSGSHVVVQHAMFGSVGVLSVVSLQQGNSCAPTAQPACCAAESGVCWRRKKRFLCRCQSAKGRCCAGESRIFSREAAARTTDGGCRNSPCLGDV
eukprot:m.112677 g.112677  ORF g.112677 m.112677 type:complete len:257 (-) comp19291_c0_seq4:157-927(-)